VCFTAKLRHFMNNVKCIMKTRDKNGSLFVPMKRDVRVDFEHIIGSKKKNLNLRELTPFDYSYLRKKMEEEAKIYAVHKNLKQSEKVFRKKKVVPVNVEVPHNLRTKLLPHQKRGLDWMISCEQSPVSGGILADEMGLGKTIQVLSLILTGKMGETNLVIAPVVALNQWKDEIMKHTVGINVVSQDNQKLRNDQINVILSSYGKIESIYRRNKKSTALGNPEKEENENSSCHQHVEKNEYHDDMFLFSKIYELHFQRVILDEAHAIKDSRSSTNAAISRLKCNKRWGVTGTPVQNRVSDLYSLIKFLKIEPLGQYFCKKCECASFVWLNHGARRGFCSCGHFGSLHFGWWNRKITTPVKYFGLTSRNKKIFRLIKRITSHFILRRTKIKLEKELGLPSKQLCIIRSYFSKEERDFYESIYKKTKLEFNAYIGQCDTSYVNIFSLIQKLRMAANHPFLLSKKNALICSYCHEEVFEPVQSRCGHVFCKKEAEMYFLDNRKCPVCHLKITIDFFDEKLMKESKYNDENGEINSGADTNNNIANLENGHDTTTYRLISDEKADFMVKNEKYENNQLSLIKDKQLIEENSVNGYVPVVGQGRDDTFRGVKRSVIDVNNWRSSTKIETLIELLYKIQSNARTSSNKSIIFSQFVNFLEMLSWRLERAGFRCVKIYGSMPRSQRKASIESFQNDSNIKIFLISLKAGGLALNLTEANNVFLMDPWWNPAVEEQAMDRIHRIGQFRPIKIYKIIIEDSIESKIIELQKKKKALFNSTVENDCGALEKLEREDLIFLFN
ncbi:Nucleotide excision repair protein RAD16, partial [Trachipleistophora hominis]